MTGILKLSMAMVVVSGLVGVVATERPVQAETLTLGAAPSLKPVFNEILPSATSMATSVSFRDVLPNRMTRIAVGDPGTSALGEVTARALTKLHPTYKNRYHLLHSQHSADIVDVLHRGEADMGIVYRVDAINNGQVRIIDEDPAGSYTPARFGVAVVSTCREESLDVAEKFFQFMMSPRIQKLLLKYGFDSVPSNGSPVQLSSAKQER
jgi:molybdate transport system substrate-binding protein